MLTRLLAGALKGISFLGKKINWRNSNVNGSGLIGSRCCRSAFSYTLHSSSDFSVICGHPTDPGKTLGGVPPDLEKH